MDQPLISVVLPTYNYGAYISEALESVLMQDYARFEIVILDDKSTDNTSAVVEPYLGDPRIRLVRNAENLGAGKNFAKGIELAVGDLIYCMAADDTITPGFFSSSLALRRKYPQIEASYGDVSFMDASGRVVMPGHHVFAAEMLGGPHDFAMLFTLGCYASFSTLIADARLYRDFGAFDHALTGSDLDMLFRWAQAGVVFGRLARTQSRFRLHDAQSSAPGRFSASGVDLRESALMVRRYLTEQHEERLRGFEAEAKSWLMRKWAVATEQGLVASADLHAEYEAALNRLDAVHERNAGRPFTPCFSVCIDAALEPARIATFLESLVDQSYPRWEALVVENPGGCRDPETERMARRIVGDRLRVVEPAVYARAENRWNIAMRVAHGNVFTFVTNAVRYPGTYLDELATALTTRPERLLLSTARLGGDERMIAASGATPDLLWLLIQPNFTLDMLTIRRDTTLGTDGFGARGSLFDPWHFVLRAMCRGEAIAAVPATLDIESIGEGDVSGASAADLIAQLQEIHAMFRVSDDGFISARERLVRDVRQRLAGASGALSPRDLFFTPMPSASEVAIR